MTKEQMENGQALYKLIEITKKAVQDLKGLMGEMEAVTKDGCDGAYFLHISNHRDGSGNPVDLSLNLGNRELLGVILSTLESQLKNFEKKYSEL